MFAILLAFTIFKPAVVCASPHRTSAPEPFDWRAAIAADQALPPGSINDHEAVEIGGIKQWISVRGTNPNNPILLFLHGGPGSPMMPQSWTFQRPWEDFFTVVQWDQRGAGQTFAASGRKLGDRLTIDRMQDDTEEVIEYLLKHYKKRKIFLLGHSWGSILGLRVAKHRPDLLYAYIGVGQVINVMKNEALGYSLTLAKAQKEGNQRAIMELKSIAPFPGNLNAESVAHLAIEGKWDSYFCGMRYARRDEDEAQMWMMSPLYTSNDVRSAELGEQATLGALGADLLSVNLESIRSLDCPFFLLEGTHDYTTPTVLAKAFFEQVTAPHKEFFEFPNAAHYIVSEAPGQVLVDLVERIRPLAEETGDQERRSGTTPK